MNERIKDALLAIAIGIALPAIIIYGPTIVYR